MKKKEQKEDFVRQVLNFYNEYCVVCNSPHKQCFCPGVRQSVIYNLHQVKKKGIYKETYIYGQFDYLLFKKLKVVLGRRGTWHSNKMISFSGAKSDLMKLLKKASVNMSFLVNW